MENMTKTRDLGAVEKAVASGLPLPGNHHELVIQDIMNRDVVTASSSDTIWLATAKMSENKVSCVVVVDDGHVTGILTQKDVLQGVAGEEADFHLQKVSKRMSSPVEVISASWSVMEGGKLMESKGIKRLPVVEGHKLVGIVTQTDITRGLILLTPLRCVADIMSSNIVSIDAETTVAEAAHIMSSSNVSSIVAEYQKRLVGILTERDLLKRVVALSKNPAQTRVADVMSFPVTSVPPSYSILSANNMMEKMHIHRLVIVDGKKTCGIVTQTDIMLAVRSELEKREEERQGLIAELRLLVPRCPECTAQLRS